jgi:DNA-binding YbaB/EbfC family protein
MFGDMGKMMKQVTEMKTKMAAVENELNKLIVKGTSKDSSVEIELTGKMKLKTVNLKVNLPTDKKVLEKAIFEAVDSALTQVSNTAQQKLKDVTGGMKIPGL